MGPSYVEIDQAERSETLVDLWRIKTYPFVPCFKDRAEARASLEAGYVDFIADMEYWDTGPVEAVAPLASILTPIVEWGNADVGYSVRALTLDGAMDIVNRTIAWERSKNPPLPRRIYFRVLCPEIRNPRSHVDTDLWIHGETLAQYQAGGPIRRDLYDI